MDDVIFIGKLFQRGLLPNDWKAKLNSLPATPAEKAAKFLDNIIEPDIQGGNFTKLLSIMSEDGSMKKLADTIRSEFEPTSTSGSTTSSTGEYCLQYGMPYSLTSKIIYEICTDDIYKRRTIVSALLADP